MLGKNLKKLRYQCGLTQKQVADLLTVDRSTYTYYETGRTRPDVDMIVKIAKIYKVSCDELLDYKSDRESSGALVVHSEQTEYNVLRKALSICDLDRQEQDLILVYRQLDDIDRGTILHLAKERMLDNENKKKEES